MREAVQLMRKLWTEERVTFEGNYYQTEKATIYDRPERRCRSMSPPPARWWRNTPAAAATALSAPAARSRSSTPRRCCRTSRRGLKRPAAPKPNYDQMIEVKVSFDTDQQRALEDTRHLGRAGAVAGGEDVGRGPARDGAAGRCAAAGARRQPLDRLRRPGGACRAHRVLHRAWLQASGLPRAGPRPGALPRPCTESGCCPCCAAASGERRGLALLALPGCRWWRRATTSARSSPEGMARAGLSPQPATCWRWRRRSSARRRGAACPWPPSRPPPAPSAWRAETGKDPRLVELILSESVRVVRARPNLIIVQHRLGFVMANAGIDQSNVGEDGHRAAAAAWIRMAAPRRFRRGSACRW